jgi:hypothetical protein
MLQAAERTAGSGTKFLRSIKQVRRIPWFTGIPASGAFACFRKSDHSLNRCNLFLFSRRTGTLV